MFDEFDTDGSEEISQLEFVFVVASEVGECQYTEAADLCGGMKDTTGRASKIKCIKGR